MSGPGENTDEIVRDDAMLAAEHALGLLEGEELLTARGKLATDPAYAARKDWWDVWFAPWTDEIAGAEPGAHVWDGIAARVHSPAETQGADVVDLETRLRRWKWVAGATSAAAALMVAVLIANPGGDPAAPVATDTPQIAAATPQAPLTAQVPIGETGLRLDVTYIPETEQLLVGAIGLTADGVHDHELWLVPEDGSGVQSLGVVAPGEVRSVELGEDVIRNMGEGVQVLLSREPLGGKPEGVDPGPIVAQGAFSQV